VQQQKGTWRYGSMHVGCGFDAHSIGGEGFATRVNLPGQTLVRGCGWYIDAGNSIRDRYVECISRGTAAPPPGRSSPVGSSVERAIGMYNI
jgi:hypothetical protein